MTGRACEVGSVTGEDLDAAEPAVTIRRALDDSTVSLAIWLVDNMGVVGELDEWTAQERKGPGGRPELFPKRALLVAMAICALCEYPLVLTQVCDVMFNQLSDRWRAELAIPSVSIDDRATRLTLYRDVRTRFHAVVDLMDPSPFPKNRRLDDHAFEAAVALKGHKRSDAERAERAERLQWFVNQVLEASIRRLPRRDRRRWKGSVGVDETFVPSFARSHKNVPGSPKRGKKQILVHSADPDAGGYRREPDDRDDDGQEGPGKEKLGYGYEVPTAVSASDGPGDHERFPSLAVGMSILHRPGTEPGRNGLRALKSISDRKHPANWLAADRAYSSAKYEDFQLPARALGYRPVYDYKANQLAQMENWQGFIQVEGDWYCPMMPEDLIGATADYRAKRIDKETHEKRIDERGIYRARLKQRPDAEGYERWYCPAAGSAPRVRCDLKPRSESRATGGRRVYLKGLFSQTAPACCTQQTVTIPPHAGAKFRQELPYGSPECHEVYNRIRNTNEGYFGFAKTESHEALDKPGRRRVHGVAAQTVFVAFTFMAANIRSIRSFLEEMAEEAGKLRRLPRRRKTKALSDWLPAVKASVPESGPDPPSTA